MQIIVFIEMQIHHGPLMHLSMFSPSRGVRATRGILTFFKFVVKILTGGHGTIVKIPAHGTKIKVQDKKLMQNTAIGQHLTFSVLDVLKTKPIRNYLGILTKFYIIFDGIYSQILNMLIVPCVFV